MKRVLDEPIKARKAAIGGLLILGLAACLACSSSPGPGEVEETATESSEIPEAVLETADSVARRIGAGHCDAWYWDNEDQDWECTFVGLSRQAELDILPDGGFSELELVYGLEEVERILADEALYIRERCRDDPDVVIELSLRREEHLDDVPELAEAWSKSGVVLEFQCPNGVDYEIDALHGGVMRKVDDKHDASAEQPPKTR